MVRCHPKLRIIDLEIKELPLVGVNHGHRLESDE